jgi:hypothetical protein
MKISKTHQKFSDYLEEPKALTNPEDFLGPNWEDVLNFWLYVDTLTDDEKKAMINCYWALDQAGRMSAWDASRVAANEVVGKVVGLEVSRAALNASFKEVSRATLNASFDVTRLIFGHATNELISHHKLLEQGKTLLALSTILN